jgi:hypothetical protein
MPPLRDKKYLASYAEARCAACDKQGREFGVVGAHIRTGSEAGWGMKPSDSLTLPLCFECHSDQEAHPGPWWWTQHVLKNLARRRYSKFLEAQYG